MAESLCQPTEALHNEMVIGTKMCHDFHTVQRLTQNCISYQNFASVVHLYTLDQSMLPFSLLLSGYGIDFHEDLQEPGFLKIVVK